jgi:hypothetical protein
MKKQLTGLKLTAASPLLTMVAIGTSIEGRTIYMIVGTTASNFDPQTLKNLGNQRYWSKLYSLWRN